MYSGQDTNNRKSDFFFFADGHFCEESVWAFIQVQLYGQHAVVILFTLVVYDLDNFGQMCLTRQHLRHVVFLVILLWFFITFNIFSAVNETKPVYISDW